MDSIEDSKKESSSFIMQRINRSYLKAPQNSNYQKLLLPKEVKRIVIEPSNDFHWLMFATDINHIIGIKDYGESGHFEELKEKFGFTEEQLLAKVKELIVNNK